MVSVTRTQKAAYAPVSGPEHLPIMYGVTPLQGGGFQPWAYEVPGQATWQAKLSPALWARCGMLPYATQAAGLAAARETAERLTERYLGDWQIFLIEASETNPNPKDF